MDHVPWTIQASVLRPWAIGLKRGFLVFCVLGQASNHIRKNGLHCLGIVLIEERRTSYCNQSTRCPISDRLKPVEMFFVLALERNQASKATMQFKNRLD